MGGVCRRRRDGSSSDTRSGGGEAARSRARSPCRTPQRVRGKTYGETVWRGLAPAEKMLRKPPFNSLPCVKELTHMRSMCVGVAETGSEVARSPLSRLPCVKGAGTRSVTEGLFAFCFIPAGKRGVLLRDQKYQKSAKEGFSPVLCKPPRTCASVPQEVCARTLCRYRRRQTPAERKSKLFLISKSAFSTRIIRYICGIFSSPAMGEISGFISPHDFSFVARANIAARGKRVDSRKRWRRWGAGAKQIKFSSTFFKRD